MKSLYGNGIIWTSMLLNEDGSTVQIPIGLENRKDVLNILSWLIYLENSVFTGWWIRAM